MSERTIVNLPQPIVQEALKKYAATLSRETLKYNSEIPSHKLILQSLDQEEKAVLTAINQLTTYIPTTDKNK